MVEKDFIPLPQVSEFLLEDFMVPMNLSVHDVSEGANIPIYEMQAILNDEIEITPDLSEKLAAFFGVSDMLFYKIQNDIKSREAAAHYVVPESVLA
ncbi:MAG: hypothetical protein IJ859_11270 [Synergistaceae bacterium]|nr:hypothetical protein [Synergistaceae bacterium]